MFSGMNNENFEYNYGTNASNLLHISNNSEKNFESHFDKLANNSKSSKTLKPLNEFENFDKKPTLEFYKSYCQELENIIENLMENMSYKTERLNEMEKIQTENLDLKRQMRIFTKTMSLAQADFDVCKEEICIANKLKLNEMKNNYDKILKIQNQNKLNKLIFDD